MKKSRALTVLWAVFTAVSCLLTPAGATEVAEIYPDNLLPEPYWSETYSAVEYVPSGDAKGLILMEFDTGEVLFKQNESVRLPLASVTKVMSTLLVMEAIDSGRISLTDAVTASENAASMGGSQIFLEPGEEMSVHDLLKALIIASANDATVALGEYLCGSESSFVAEMNRRALELGCVDTNFVNTNGLPAEGHFSSAYDVALMTRELMKHELVFAYTGIWTDTVRDGAFGLANTNKLIRFYKGATGMKTGFTDEAGYCLSATAERDGMKLIAVILGASTSDKRFSEAKGMLDYGFANYSVITPEPPQIDPLPVTKGSKTHVAVKTDSCKILTGKGSSAVPECTVTLNESITAPVKEGDVLGYAVYTLEGSEVARVPVTSCENVERASWRMLFCELLKRIFGSM